MDEKKKTSTIVKLNVTKRPVNRVDNSLIAWGVIRLRMPQVSTLEKI